MKCLRWAALPWLLERSDIFFVPVFKPVPGRIMKLYSGFSAGVKEKQYQELQIGKKGEKDGDMIEKKGRIGMRSGTWASWQHTFCSELDSESSWLFQTVNVRDEDPFSKILPPTPSSHFPAGMECSFACRSSPGCNEIPCCQTEEKTGGRSQVFSWTCGRTSSQQTWKKAPPPPRSSVGPHGPPQCCGAQSQRCVSNSHIVDIAVFMECH